jgi:yeast amino acid transporter
VLNLIAVAWYGEAEFWFASIKIIAIVGMIILGIVLFFGGGSNHDRLGFRYWKHPGAVKEYLVSGNTGRFLAFWISLVKAGFSFILAPEFIAVAAGECQAPRRNLPKATRRFIYRLLVFYVLGSLIIGVIVPYNSNRLLSAINSGASGAAASPFVIGIQNAGIPVLNHIMNAVILTSAWSSSNSSIFYASRVLYSLSRKKQAPSIFMKCNRKGVPYVAVLATFAISLLSYLNLGNSGATVFGWLTSIITVIGLIAWCVVLTTYLVSF